MKLTTVCVDAIIEEFDMLGILPHTKPNAIGLWPNEQECLVWCALQVDPSKHYIEVGSFCGGSTILLGLANQSPDHELFVYDIAFNPMFDLNMKRAKLKNIYKVQCDSSELLFHYPHGPESVGFVFLDGYHAFRNVIREFESVMTVLCDDAIVAFHDCSPNMWTNSNQSYIRDRYEFACDNYNNLMNSNEEDFYIDEAIAYICIKYGYKIIDIPIRQPLAYHKETGLSGWVRGRTSPHNAFTAIRKIK